MVAELLVVGARPGAAASGRVQHHPQLRHVPEVLHLDPLCRALPAMREVVKNASDSDSHNMTLSTADHLQLHYVLQVITSLHSTSRIAFAAG